MKGASNSVQGFQAVTLAIIFYLESFPSEDAPAFKANTVDHLLHLAFPGRSRLKDQGIPPCTAPLDNLPALFPCPGQC